MRKRRTRAQRITSGANLAHLLNLVQVTDAKDLSPVWEVLARASKHQQHQELLVLGGPHQGLLEGGEIFCVSDLHQVHQVLQVGAKVLLCALVFLFLTNALVL